MFAARLAHSSRELLADERGVFDVFVSVGHSECWIIECIVLHALRIEEVQHKFDDSIEIKIHICVGILRTL